MFFAKCVSTKTIRLFALDFCEVIVDEGFAFVNYHLIEIESIYSIERRPRLSAAPD